MSVQTRIFTSHTVTQPGAPFVAAMMLDDAGQGNVTLNTPDGRPALTLDASRLESVIVMLQECVDLRGLMAQDGTDLLIGEIDPHTELL